MSCRARPALILRHAFIPLDNVRLAHLCGSLDEHLRGIEAALDVRISRRNESFRVEGAKGAAERAVALLQSLYDRARKPIGAEAFQLALTEAAADLAAPPRRRSAPAAPTPLHDAADVPIVLRTRHADLRGRTPNQVRYLRSILTHDISFGIGPAGTGKTYLAMAMAVSALKDEKVSRIILTRPAVEAGEALGFLPGDLFEKIAPYLRPLQDALHDMLPAEEIQKLTERGIIEIAPLAYMRGRTLNNAFIILDEAQNSTTEQMFMFLTRLGYSSKAVITGDITQIDLPANKHSGLVEARHALRDVEGIAIVEFSKRDVVRHPLVQKIITAYEEHRNLNK